MNYFCCVFLVHYMCRVGCVFSAFYCMNCGLDMKILCVWTYCMRSERTVRAFHLFDVCVWC